MIFFIELMCTNPLKNNEDIDSVIEKQLKIMQRV